MAAATSNDPLAAGNIAATLVNLQFANLFTFFTLSNLQFTICKLCCLLYPFQISLVVTVVVSKMKPDEAGGWRLTQSIINPLTPWMAAFEKELKVVLTKKKNLQNDAGERGAHVVLDPRHGRDH